MSSHFVGDIFAENNDFLSAIANATGVGGEGYGVGEAVEERLSEDFGDWMTWHYV
jgi:hypothetical protein